MLDLHNPYRRNDVESKEALRAHVDQLSPDKQREFVAVALQLISERFHYREPEIHPNYRQFLRAATD
jgi:hypothetical protein